MTKKQLQAKHPKLIELVASDTFQDLLAWARANNPFIHIPAPQDASVMVNNEGRLTGFHVALAYLSTAAAPEIEEDRSKVTPYSEPVHRNQRS